MKKTAQIRAAQAVSWPAAFLANGLKTSALRTNDLLRKQEWEQLDTAVVGIARQRLNGIADLRNMGLVHQLGGLGTLISQYEQSGDMSAADIGMEPRAPGEKDSQTFTLKSVPVPIIYKEFQIGIRRLEASRRLGETIDVTQAQTAARLVRDGLETILFNGASVQVDGNPIYGYTTHPNRNPYSGSDWGTITNIYTDVIGMIDAAEADNMFGPYILYVAKTQFGQMRAVYTDGSGQTAMQRVKTQLPQITDVKPGDVLAAGSATLVQMTSDVVDLAVAEDIQTVQWETRGGMELNFMVLAAMAPRPKSDADGRSGVVHATGI